MSDSGDDRSLLDAVAFAARAHKGQERKDGRTPYASHPFRVCLIVRHLFGFDDRRMLITALLHDTIEDTTTDFDDLADKFGNEIAEWVAYLSKDKRRADDQRERAYIEGLQSAPWQVQVCKLADVYDNLQDATGLAEERRKRTIGRAEQYVGALAVSKAPQLAQPLALVQQLLRRVRSD